MSGNLAVSNNLSVAGSITSSSLTSQSATIPTLTVQNLTVSNTTNIGSSNLIANTLTTNSIVANTSIVSPQISVGTQDVGPTLTNLRTDLTTAQTNIATVLTRTNNQAYAPTTQTTTFTGTLATPITNASGLLTCNAGLTIPSGQTINLNGNIISDGATITPTELSYVDGLNSNVQTQINTKANATNGNHMGNTTMQTLAVSGLITANGGLTIPTTKAINLNGDIITNTTPARTITPTEISYLDGITSSIQVQLNNKPNINGGTMNNATFTGTTNGITKSMVGLGNVDNVADIDKIVSTPQQTALNLKANINNTTLTGSTNIENLNVTNQFTVNSLGTSNLTYNNSIISNPPVLDGFGKGSGDGLSYSIFNNAIFSWFATGFVDTCNKVCNLLIDHRAGSIIMKGELNSTSVQTTTMNATQTNTNTLQTNSIGSSTGSTSVTSQIKASPMVSLQSLGTYVGVWVVNAGATDSKFDRMYPVIASQKKMGKIDDYWIVASGYKVELYTGLGYTGTKHTIDNTMNNTFSINRSSTSFGSSNSIDSCKVFYGSTEITLTDF